METVKVRRCTQCKKEKPLSQFYIHRKNFQPQCKYCMNENKKAYYHAVEKHLPEEIRYNKSQKRRTGITYEQYHQKLKQQNNACAICKRSVDEVSKRGKYLDVDHDHLTGQIRGLLCNKCNIGLGCFQDDTNLMQMAINYLESFKAI